MATGQSLLDRVELIHSEMQLQSGESDVTRGLVALNVAQDQLEVLLATIPEALSTAGNVSVSSATATTAVPSTLLRLDKLVHQNGSGQPLGPVLGRLDGSAGMVSEPDLFTSVSSTPGKPTGYWFGGSLIYWFPQLPDAAYTLTAFGLYSASDITAGGTFAYPDSFMLPLATFAARLLREGVDDDTSGLVELASETFGPVLKLVSNRARDGAESFRYRYLHDT